MATHLKKQISRLLFFLLFLASVSATTAQHGKTINKFYFQAGGRLGSNYGPYYDLNLQSVIKNKWSATLSYQSFSIEPDNIPEDYKPATSVVVFFFIPVVGPAYNPQFDNLKMNLINLTAGRYFKLGRNIWTTTEGGISIVKKDELNFTPFHVVTNENWSQNINPILGEAMYETSNYTTSVNHKTTVGASMKADINWAFASFMGLGFGVFANVNSFHSPVGYQFKLMLGDMGKEKKNKK